MPDNPEGIPGGGHSTDADVNKDTVLALLDPVCQRSGAIKDLVVKRRTLVDSMRKLVSSDDFSAEDKEKFDKMEVEERTLKDRQDRLGKILVDDDRLRQDVEKRKSEDGTDDIDILLPNYRHDVAIRDDETLDINRLFRTWALGKHADEEEKEFARRCNYPLNEIISLLAHRGVTESGVLSSAPRTHKEITSRTAILHLKKRALKYKHLMGAACRESHRMDLHFRAQSVGTTTAGGFTVPDEMMREIDIALLDLTGPRASSTILQTMSGADLPIPTTDDTANKGEIIAENAAANEQDVTFGQVVMKHFKYSSKVVKVSMEWLQDSATQVPALLGRLLGERMARIHAEHFTTGDGTTQPEGILTASSLGKTLAAGQVATFKWEDIMDLEHSVDPSYRTQPGAGFMMHDSALLVMKQISDSQGRPLWQTSLVTGNPGTFDGYPIQLNQEMPVPAASAKSMLFGALRKFWIRDILPLTFIRVDELFALNGQIGFLMWSRNDSRLIDAGTKPIKHMVHPAS